MRREFFNCRLPVILSFFFVSSAWSKECADLSYQLTPVKTQLAGDCYAYNAVGALEAAFYRKMGKKISLSEEFIVMARAGDPTQWELRELSRRTSGGVHNDYWAPRMDGGSAEEILDYAIANPWLLREKFQIEAVEYQNLGGKALLGAYAHHPDLTSKITDVRLSPFPLRLVPGLKFRDVEREQINASWLDRRLNLRKPKSWNENDWTGFSRHTFWDMTASPDFPNESLSFKGLQSYIDQVKDQELVQSVTRKWIYPSRILSQLGHRNGCVPLVSLLEKMMDQGFPSNELSFPKKVSDAKARCQKALKASNQTEAFPTAKIEALISMVPEMRQELETYQSQVPVQNCQQMAPQLEPQISSTVCRGVPVVVGLAIEGVKMGKDIASATPWFSYNSSIHALHGMLVVGIEEYQGDRYYRMRNSWGPGHQEFAFVNVREACRILSATVVLNASEKVQDFPWLP